MTEMQRQRLHDLMMGGCGIEGIAELDDVVTHDLDVIEPAIDEMLADAFQAGLKGLNGTAGRQATKI